MFLYICFYCTNYTLQGQARVQQDSRRWLPGDVYFPWEHIQHSCQQRRKKTKLLGHVWESYINFNDLTPGKDTLMFSMNQCPARIYVTTTCPRVKTVDISSDDDSLEEEDEEEE